DFSFRKVQILNSQSTDFSIRKVQISQFAKCRFAKYKFAKYNKPFYCRGVPFSVGRSHACHLKQFQSSQQQSSENIEAKIYPPRVRFPIPPDVFGSPSCIENYFISDDDYKQPLTPANAKIAYNQHVYKIT
ncbi:hypothetical protein OS493_040112, partial [Desmophyllum pertusum]